ncbi:MAG: hypothetical protein AAB632_01380 [Patescibacteria group bacterium]
MKFIVEYSIERDMYNYLNAIWRMKYTSFGRDDLREKLLSSKPEQFQEDIKKAKTEEEAKKVIVSYLESRLKTKKPEIDKNIRDIQKVIDDNKDVIIKTLESVFNKDFSFDEVFVYLTTAGICPLNFEKRWFMVYDNANDETVVRVATHELNHFMFFYYYTEKLKTRMDIHRFKVLKEALVILTNPEGNRGGKPETIELEGYLKTVQGRPMDEIIELAIKSEAFKKLQSE